MRQRVIWFLSALALMLGMVGVLAGRIHASEPAEGKPPEKKMSPAWLHSLTARGEPALYRGAALKYIGMPVGGLCAGQLYLGGDGRLWHWDLFNLAPAGPWSSCDGPDYARPLVPSSPLEQGFALKVTAGGKTQLRLLDRRGFEDITFRGQYPIGRVNYRDPALPVTVALEAFSPFIPLNVEDSSLPATVLHFTVTNTGAAAAEVELAGWLENAVCLDSGKRGAGRRRNHILTEPGLTLLHCTAEAEPEKEHASRRPDTLFEDFEKPTYEGWKIEGTAFGAGPVRRSAVPAYQGDVGGKGERVVNSHASAPGRSVAEKDAHTGKLTSRVFTIERRYLHFFIGGGNQPGKTCLNLVVGGKVVRTATGRNDNRMRPESFDLRGLEGQPARIEIVDAATGPWGNVGVDHLVFSDGAPERLALARQVDFGSMGLALLGRTPGDFARSAVPLDGTPAGALLHVDGTEAEAVEPFGRRLGGALGRRWTVPPGRQAEAVFVLAWYFPALPRGHLDHLTEAPTLRRSYASRFASAANVARYLARDYERLAGQTRLWNRTWYDSTLPCWFLDRAFLTTCNLATATCYRFTSGRFYGFEGVYSCDGTCTHVWHYAQGPARLFPELERSTRELVDYGLAFHPESGAIDYRGEYGRQVAVDGQAGTVLRAYREHQMSADSAFLRRNWPKIKKSLEHLIARDAGQEGLLDGEQYNTLDASWYGHIPWLSSLYLASLRAGAAISREMEDMVFARRCEALADRGGKRLVEQNFNGEYFIQTLDPRHLDAINTNTGCHIDQVLGQSWAFQVGLPRVLPEPATRSALEALWKHNFRVDIGPYRRQFKAIPGGRWYALPGEGGLLMCTWPRGGAERARGSGNAAFAAYFNECMTGFEYQVAAHLIWEGLVDKGLALVRTIHERYRAELRNPWNEIECGDHYARSMASYGVFLAACGFEYHGPQGHLGFAPRLTPGKFRAPFTAAEGWGTFSQTQNPDEQRATLEVKWGRLRLRTLALAVANTKRAPVMVVTVNNRRVAAKTALEGNRLLITLADEAIIQADEKMEVTIR